MVKVSEWFKKEVGTISLLLKNWEEQHCKSNYFHIHLFLDQAVLDHFLILKISSQKFPGF